MLALQKRLDRAEARLAAREAARYASPLAPVDLFTRVVGGPPDPWQADLLHSTDPRVLLLCSRQAGKSQTTAVIALDEVLRPDTLTLALAPAERQSQELFRRIIDGYMALGQPVPATSTTATSLELANGSRIVALPGVERTIRSFSGVSLLIIDEAARVEDPLYYGVRPMLAVSQGRLIALSSAWGRQGWFYEAWEGSEPWRRVRVPATEVPRIAPEFLEEERRALPWQVYQAEYMCLFADQVSQLFASADVEAALTPTVRPLFGG